VNSFIIAIKFNNKEVKNMIKKSIFVVFLVLLGFSSFIGVSYDYQDPKDISMTENSVLSKILDKRDNNNFNSQSKVVNSLNIVPNEKLAKDFFKAKNKNSDTKAFLSINKVAYYPVMNSGDNEFYLKHNASKGKSKLGAIFMNKDSDGNFDNIALLHGHRMKNGKMFGSLARYESKEFFLNNSPIEIFDGQYFYYYKPYTLFRMKDGHESTVQDFYNKDRPGYFKKLHEKSKIKIKDQKIDYNADMLYLSTCDYNFQDARLIIGSELIAKVTYEK